MSLYTQLSCDKTYIVCKGVHTIYVESPDLATYQSPYTHASYDYHVRQDKYSKVRENEKKNSEKNFAVFHIFVRHCLRSWRLWYWCACFLAFLVDTFVKKKINFAMSFTSSSLENTASIHNNGINHNYNCELVFWFWEITLKKKKPRCSYSSWFRP